jgi:hypothetical protein
MSEKSNTCTTKVKHLASLKKNFTKRLPIIFIIWPLIIISCTTNQKDMDKIIFLHHSTGSSIWVGKTNKYIYKVTQEGDVQKFFADYNKKNRTNYEITQLAFPKTTPYGWNNYPYDYYNIWVKNAGEIPYLEEPTLEILTKEFDVIIFKHCFPVSRISEDTGNPDIDSDEKRVENYKLQYNALKQKMHEFPNNKFIVWTPVVCTKNTMAEDEAKRTYQFYKWMIDEWDEKGDNIFIWDYYKYETEGNLYLLDKNAVDPDNSHPNREFSAIAASLFSNFIIEVIESKSE